MNHTDMITAIVIPFTTFNAMSKEHLIQNYCLCQNTLVICMTMVSINGLSLITINLKTFLSITSVNFSWPLYQLWLQTMTIWLCSHVWNNHLHATKNTFCHTKLSIVRNSGLPVASPCRTSKLWNTGINGKCLDGNYTKVTENWYNLKVQVILCIWEWCYRNVNWERAKLLELA